LKFKNIFSNKIYAVVFLTAVVLISVSLLMAVNNVTAPEVKAQQEDKIKSLLSGIFPQMGTYDYEDEIYTVYQDDKEIGYAFLANGKGYGGGINILVGLDRDFIVKKVIIVSNTETPGLGSKITKNSFTDQFAGLSAGDIFLKKNGGKIDAVTGATISSDAVVEAVRNTMLEKIDAVK
jgi:electron transport complex protein RnfG